MGQKIYPLCFMITKRERGFYQYAREKMKIKKEKELILVKVNALED
jgi:hypothetical protein